jgi:ABC-type glycerol-3-phosphate transport system substrate-binding protein
MVLRYEGAETAEMPRAATRRTALSTLVGGVGALALAACGAPGQQPGGGSPAADAAPAKISFWARGSQEFTDMMGAIAKAYTEANPKITIDGGYFPSDGYTDRLVTAAASDTLPDVYHQDSQNVVSLANKGVAADVAPLLAKDGKVKKSDFFNWAFLRAEKDGRLYAMPFKGTCNVMYVNEALVQKRGATLPKAGCT